MAEQKQQEELERGKMVATPSFVTFPKSSNNTDTTASVKLQAEDSATSPKNMWQVYALGGFMVLRWIWARWKERKARGGSSEEAST
ncbi:hypothetical protein AMTRI_Chr11g93250 [Amborella trichopoda]